MDWLKAIIALLGAIRYFFHAKENADARRAGRDEANASTLREGAERVAEAHRIEAEPDRDEDDGFRRD